MWPMGLLFPMVVGVNILVNEIVGFTFQKTKQKQKQKRKTLQNLLLTLVTASAHRYATDSILVRITV